METGGRRSFADLSGLILGAFGFDREHLYVFSLKRKPYDPDGIYHPAGRKGRRADRVRLQDVEPAVRNKYLYLYDFGDEWMFYIAVAKVWETEQEITARVTDGQGELSQYGEEDEWWEEDGDPAFGGGNEEAPGEGELSVIPAEGGDEAVQAALAPLPAVLQAMWRLLADGELMGAGCEEMELLRRLEKAGLVEIGGGSGVAPEGKARKARLQGLWDLGSLGKAP